MPDMPRTKFNSPWTVENIETELNGTKNARGNLTMTEKLAQKVETSTYATDKAALDAGIAAVANAGAKNIFDIQATTTVQRTTTVLNPDGGITISCNAAVWATRNVIAEIPAGDYICSLFVDAVTIGGGAFAFFVNQSNDQSTWTELARQTSITSISRIDKLITVTQKYLRITTNINNSDTSATNSATIRLMLRPASITDDTFVPYALPNPTLTPAAVKAVDDGAKNLFDIQHPSTTRSTTYNTTSDGGVELTCTNAVWTQYMIDDIPVESGREYTFTLYVDEISGTNTLRIYVRETNGSGDLLYDSKDISTVNTLTATITPNTNKIWVGIYLNNSATAKTASAKIRAMICTAADWAVSQKFVPYAPTNRELYAKKIDHDLPVVSGSILDYANTFAPGIYFARQSSDTGSGKPVNNRRYVYNIYVYSSATATIMAIEGEDPSNPRMYLTNKVSGTWGSWYKFEGTQVATVQSSAASLMQTGRIDAELTDAETLTNGEEPETESREEER